MRSVHDDLDRHPVEKSTLLARIRCYLGALDLWTRTSTSSGFTYVLKKKDTAESFILLFFSPKNLVQLFILKEVRSCIILPSGQALSRWQNDTTSYI